MTKESLMTNMRERLRLYRQSHHWTQKELGKKCNLSQTTIAQVESGDRDPSVETLLDICLALNVPVKAIFDPMELR